MMSPSRHANSFAIVIFGAAMSLNCLLSSICSTLAAEDGQPVWSSQTEPGNEFVKLNIDAQKNTNLQASIVKEGTLSLEIPALSYVLADETQTIRLRSVGSGKVLHINLTPGARVEKGEVLLEYRNDSLRVAHIQAIQARATLAAAQAAKNEAEIAYQRAKQLAGHALSRGEERKRYALLQEATNTVAMREADVTNTENRVKEFYTITEQGDQLQISRIMAPVEGTVLAINTSSDADLTAGQDVATIVNLSSVWIVSEVPPSDALLLSPGCEQSSAFPGNNNKWIPSLVDTIDGVVNPKTGMVRIRSRISNDHNFLKPGMMLETRFKTARKIRGKLIPSEAIQRINDRDIVFVQKGSDHFEARSVQKGIESNGQTIILKGLNDGDKIVSQGGFTLKSVMLLADGSRSD